MDTNYSYITKIEVENFMSISHAILEYDDSNIISICGFNDSGKSAITRAVSIVLYDNYQRDQVKFIKEGTEYFKITLHFSDGVSVSKMKNINGVSIWVLARNGEVLYTNQLKTGIQAVTDVPEVIQKYLGVLKDDCTDALMNVRRNSDKLFLIDTTGGDNYKILNTILKSDVLAKASMSMIADKNRKNNELQVKCNTFNTLVQQCDAMEVAPVEDVEKLQSLIKGTSESNLKYLDVKLVKDKRDEINAACIYDELSTVEMESVEALDRLIQLYKDCNEIVQPELAVVDTSKVLELERIQKSYQNSLDVSIPEIQGIDYSRIQELESIKVAYMNYANMGTESKRLEQEYNSAVTELHSLSKEYGFKICPHCGSVVE